MSGYFGTYDIGDVIELTANFQVDGQDTDPTSITIDVRDPDGDIVSLTPTHDGDGNYHADLVATLPGRWYYRWAGTGAAEAAGEKVLWVRNRIVGEAGS